ncbi:hypothetical protein AAEX28_15855 [Lentisphaerota bacterium WC36G]|nr:hypothetical protein LJT99_02615 [Lentisphaerae bacterium WC36]
MKVFYEINEDEGYCIYNVFVKKNIINIDFLCSEKSSLAETYSQSINSQKNKIALIADFKSSVIEQFSINTNNNLTENQLANLINFQLQKHLPVDINKFAILYYYSCNNNNTKLLINIHCCLKNEWNDFIEHCKDNNLKFDYILFKDNHKNYAAKEDEIKDIIEQNLCDGSKNNLAEFLPENIKIKRHKAAKQICLLMLFLVILINFYRFYTKWQSQHQQFNNHVELNNQLDNKLKKLAVLTKKQQKLYKKITALINYKPGVSRIDFIVHHLHSKLPKDCMISKFDIKNNKLNLVIISSQNILKLSKILSVPSLIISDNNGETKQTLDGKNEYTIQLKFNEFALSGDGK